MGHVVDFHRSVAVRVCQSKRLIGKRFNSGKVALDSGHVEDIRHAVKIYVAVYQFGDRFCLCVGKHLAVEGHQSGIGALSGGGKGRLSRDLRCNDRVFNLYVVFFGTDKRRFCAAVAAPCPERIAVGMTAGGDRRRLKQP